MLLIISRYGRWQRSWTSLDFEVIKTFQQLDPRYSAKKIQKLEKRFTTRDNIPIFVTTTKPSKTIKVKKVETKTSIVFHQQDDDDEKNE